MKLDIHKDREGHVKMNPSWLFQLGIVLLLSMIGYFLDNSLSEIKSELEFSRLERAQIRADLTAFQIGASGDRFTASMWAEERHKLESTMNEIRERLVKLEAKN